MGSSLSTDTIPILCTMVDVHNARAQDQFYFANISTGGAATKVIGRSQTLSVEVGISTVLTVVVYECPEPTFQPEFARCLGLVRFPIERLAERYSSGIFQQWFSLDVKADPRAPPQETRIKSCLNSSSLMLALLMMFTSRKSVYPSSAPLLKYNAKGVNPALFSCQKM